MKSEDIDKAIQDALDKNKKKSRWHRPTKKIDYNKINRYRKNINMIFLLLTAIFVVVWILCGEDKSIALIIGLIAILVKLVEFYLRFKY